MRREYAVLGAGALGLVTALRLLARGHAVTVYEREPLPGGLAAGFPVGTPVTGPLAGQQVWLDKFYHHIFTSDTEVIRLIQELGLGSDLLWRRPRTVTLVGGHVRQLDSPMTVLQFDALPVIDRLRLASALAILKLLPSPGPLEGLTAASWLRAVMGTKAYSTVFEPLLKGKFGALAGEIALPWFWGRIHDRTTALGYMRGGFQRLYDALEARIREMGGEIQLATQVQGIAPVAGGVEVSVAPVGQPGLGHPRRFDRVVSTLAVRLTSQLTPALPAEWKARYEWGRAYGAHCVILALDRPLTDSYWMNINDPGYPFMVLVEHTNYMPLEDYGGKHLVYLGNYRPMDDPIFRMDKAAILAGFLPHLARVNPAFDPSWVTETWAFAAPWAQPIVTTDYKEHIPPFATPIPGLYVASMFQVYPHDRGQNYSVELAERLVREIEPA
ncbi:MAG TPA: NAD(P)/FAD-dependent oxidoreductase [Ktedonobacterales bacterium]